MICKWCGSTIQNIDTKCAACGRDTPPMSDCGGFYNLKCDNGSQTPTIIENVVYKDRIIEKPPKWVKPVVATLLTSVIILGVVFGVQSKAFSNAKEEIETLSVQNAELIEKASEPILAEQMCSMNISVKDSSVSVNLGKYADTVTTSLLKQADVVIATTSLEQANTGVRVEMKKTDKMVVVSLHVDESAFGKKDTLLCRWLSEDGTEIASSSPNERNTTAVLRMDQLPNECESLKCEIVRTNNDGGQITVYVNGIQLDETEDIELEE